MAFTYFLFRLRKKKICSLLRWWVRSWTLQILDNKYKEPFLVISEEPTLLLKKKWKKEKGKPTFEALTFQKWSLKRAQFTLAPVGSSAPDSYHVFSYISYTRILIFYMEGVSVHCYTGTYLYICTIVNVRTKGHSCKHFWYSRCMVYWYNKENWSVICADWELLFVPTIFTTVMLSSWPSKSTGEERERESQREF
jgi:hypothetical protein